MDRKNIIISFCLLLFILPVLTVLSSTIQTNTVEWDTSLIKGTSLKWRSILTEGNPQIGSTTIYTNSTIEIMFDNDPSTLFSDLYNGEIPSWYSIYIDDVLLDPQTLDRADKEFFYGIIWPLAIHWDNGSSTPFSEFIYMYQPPDVNVLQIGTTGPNLLGVRWESNISSQTYHFIVNNNTGIASIIEKFDGPNAFVFEIGMGESTSTTTQEEEDNPVKIEWGTNIEKGTILAWNVTKFEVTPEVDFKIGSTPITQGTFVQLGFIKNPPTNPASYFEMDGSPSWLELLVNGNKIDLNTIEEEGDILQFLVLPVNFIFENGSVFHLIDFVNHINEDGDLTNFIVEDDASSIFCSWVEYWEDDGIQGHAKYNLTWNKATGTLGELSILASDGNMTWNYFEEAANVDQSGTTKTIADEYSVTLDYPSPSFQLLPVIAFLLVLVAIRKKRR
ncbi:MAG: hypothetical protein ACTSW1_04815 [Candidatus Hodarchaeales archaeon]